MSKLSDKQVTERVVRLIESGVISWKKIAELAGVSRKTLQRWRDTEDDTFSKQFADSVDLAFENYNSGEIKAGQVEQAKKHTLRKNNWEYRAVDVRSLDKKEKKKANIKTAEKDEDRTKAKFSPPPEMPPTWMTKAYLVDYGEQVLDLSIGETNLSISEIMAECLLRVKELTVTIRVKIEIEQEVDPNQAAVKNVLTNAGKKEERWSFKEEHEHGVDDELGELLTEIGSSRTVLPRQEDIKDFDDKG